MSYIKQFQLGYNPNYKNYTKPPFAKSDFPIFSNNKNLVWFDNGATTQKPSYVIDSVKQYYEKYNSNIHRSPHQLSIISSTMFDNARLQTAKYLGCSAKEIVFVKGTTEGINFLANAINFAKLGYYGRPTVLLTNMEHHSNIVPWQLLNSKQILNLEYLIYDKNNNSLNLTELENILIKNPYIAVVSVTHVSNVLGITNPINAIAQIVHKYNRILIVDGAQGIPHHKPNVKEMDCDAYVFSSHKLFGPTGVGVVYCNENLYQYLDPWQGGGSMIKDVTLGSSTFQDAPQKYEAGTPNIADIIAFGHTLEYLERVNWADVESYEKELTNYMYGSIKSIPGIVLLGDTLVNKVPIFSFVLSNIDNQALLTELDNNGIAIRYGHHCAQPIIRDYGYENVYRASLAPYNTIQEIDYFVSVIKNFVTKNKIV